MCEAASFKVTMSGRDYVAFWLDWTDSHSEIVEHYKLNDKTLNVRGESRLFSCEIIPPDHDYNLPINKWVFECDTTPEWADMAKVEAACRKELPKWYKKHVIKKGKHILTGDISRIILGGEVEVVGQTGGCVQFYNSSKGAISGQADGVVQFYNSSKGTISGQIGGYVQFYDSSKGTISEQTGGDVRFFDSSKGTISGQTGGDVRFFNSSQNLS